jgi:multidrug resistance efflux pump
MKKNFSQHWLEILCSIIPEANSAMFMMLDTHNKEIRPLAKWPPDLKQYGDFTPIVKYALKKQKQVCIPNIPSKDKKPFDFYALPVYLKTELLGVIVLKVHPLPSSNRTEIFNSLQLGAQWLQLSHTDKHHDDSFYNGIVGFLAACFEQESYQKVLIQLVTELTQKFDCERVAFAEYKKNHCEVVALSNSADFDERANIMQKFSDAMDEAIDQDSNIIYPDSKPTFINHAHRILADGFDTASLCSIPLVYQQQVFGAITLMRTIDKPFDNETVNKCQLTMALVAPFLSSKKESEKSLTQKLLSTFKKKMGGIFGLKFLKVKLFTIATSLVLLFSSLIEIDFRVTSDAILEGKIQRIVAAPIEGYLVSASVQAGDTVAKDDIMATLEDSELKLELAKLNGQIQQTRREYREALSLQDLVEVRITSAQIKQITAERDLTIKQLEKVQLIAPFDGVVIEGDLSQMLGSPVERGDTLFKIAPLEGYRVILKVDERSISYIKPGQPGTLSLSSIPNRRLNLAVKKVTAVANTEDGSNIFRVEATLLDAPDLLRPGMEGIGKINAGRAKVLWIWTHEMFDWLRLWFWSW